MLISKLTLSKFIDLYIFVFRKLVDDCFTFSIVILNKFLIGYDKSGTTPKASTSAEVKALKYDFSGIV